MLDLPGSHAAVDGGEIAPARAGDFMPMPSGTLLLTLPGRTPLAYDRGERFAFERFEGAEVNAVAAALPLGYTRTLVPAYQSRPGGPPLPLYGYAAVGWRDGQFHVAAMRTDRLESWSPRSHGESEVRKGIAARRAEFPGSGLLTQLERCALEYGCYTAQNAFLRQGEAAIPVSPACNARCIGCISEQEPDAGFESAQERVGALPAIAEMTQFAVAHLESARGAMISFGQGCEGEPLLAAPRIAAAIRAIRKRTARGTIHINTNASLPAALEALLDAGLQSVRVSLNSARPVTYAAYYRPRGYGFAEVARSLTLASKHGVLLSLNLLTHPGVTDAAEEMDAFAALLRANRIAMVQTRTLNVDPALYFSAVGRPQRMIGMRAWFAWMRHQFPKIALGNFTRGFG